MRKNKTSLTAHHFMSAPSDSLSHSFPRLVVCFTGTPSKCIPLSPPTCLFLPSPGLWQIVQYNLSTSVCLSQGHSSVEPRMDRAHTHNGPHLWVRHAKRDKHLAGEGERKTEVKSICPLSAEHWSPVIGWPLQNPANETAVLHLNTKSAALQSDWNTVDERTCWQMNSLLEWDVYSDDHFNVLLFI